MNDWIILWLQNVSVVFTGVFTAVCLYNWILDSAENRKKKRVMEEMADG